MSPAPLRLRKPEAPRVTGRLNSKVAATGSASERDSSLSSPDLIFREIVRGLYLGTYVPGQRLVEADLTLKWGVGRGAVREAFNRLAAEGIVVLSRHRGAAIRTLDRAEMLALLEVLEVLFGMAARLAAKRIDEGLNRVQFRECYEALLAFRDRHNALDLLRARYRFYRILTSVGSNSVLQEMLGGVRVHLLRVQLRDLHEDIVRERFDDYQRIAEAVHVGETRRADLAARRHIRAMAVILKRVTANNMTAEREFEKRGARPKLM